MKRKTEFVKIIIIMIVCAILMTTISFLFYNMSVRSEFYEKFISLGNHYLDREMYSEAILEFNKAIEIEEKSIDARVGAAKGYVGLDDVDSAVRVLDEAQQIEPRNEKLAIEIVVILNPVAPKEAYEMFEIYVDLVGESNIGDEAKEIYDSAHESPEITDVTAESGEYAKSFVLNIALKGRAVGHVIYYTTDGSEPTADSMAYRGGIEINRSMTVKVIGYNAVGESTEVKEFNYVINVEAKAELETAIREAKAQLDSTKGGERSGGSKQEFVGYIDEAEKLLARNIIPVEEIARVIKELIEAQAVFNGEKPGREENIESNSSQINDSQREVSQENEPQENSTQTNTPQSSSESE